MKWFIHIPAFLIVILFNACGKGLVGAGSSSTESSSKQTPGSGAPAANLIPSSCMVLPASPQTKIISVLPSQAANLPNIIATATSGTQIVLEDGTYNIAGTLAFNRSDVTLRSKSNDASKVIVDGKNGFSGSGADTRLVEVVRISASDVTIAHITFKNASADIIRVVPINSNVVRTTIHGVTLLDSGARAIRLQQNGNYFADTGSVRCSYLELTATARNWVMPFNAYECPSSGIFGTGVSDWHVDSNVLKGFWCTNTLAASSIVFWLGSKDITIENNKIINPASGILVGHGQSYPGNRIFANKTCGVDGMAFFGGVIRNNLIFANDPQLYATPSGMDYGIAIEDACGVEVYHNSIVTTGDQANLRKVSMEWRWPRTAAKVYNNLMSHVFVPRDGAVADTQMNFQNAPNTYFVDPINGDGDLRLTTLATGAIGKAKSPIGVLVDFDLYSRDATPDIGAYEYR